jgi:hypothetical protein
MSTDILRLLTVIAFLLAAASAQSIPLALGGMDVVQCASGGKCSAVGSTSWSAQYTSVNTEGVRAFSSEFRFISQENMMAFENAPITFAPRLGGFCAWNLAGGPNSTTVWDAQTLGPAVDLINSWRLVKDEETGMGSIYLFGGEDGAQAFIAGLPATQDAAEATWAAWFGSHGDVSDVTGM